MANPEVEIEFGTEHVHRHATPLTGAERDEIFARQKELMPGFADYEEHDHRVIPVVALTRSGLSRASPARVSGRRGASPAT